MGALTVGGVLRAEHEIIRTAFDEWVGMGQDPRYDLQWIEGVNTLADKLIKEMEGGDADNRC